MRKLMAAAGFLLLLPWGALAQEYGPPKAELFTGVSYLRLQKSNLLGWDTSINGLINKNLGLVLDASGFYNSQSSANSGGPGITANTSGSVYSVLAGPWVAEPVGRFTPYAQALFGWARLENNLNASASSATILSVSETHNGFGMQMGGGMDFNINHIASVRIMEVDYELYRVNGVKLNGLRLAAGLIFRLGQRQ